MFIAFNILRCYLFGNLLFHFLFLQFHLSYFFESVRVETLDVDQLLLRLCPGLGEVLELTRICGNSSEKWMRGLPVTQHGGVLGPLPLPPDSAADNTHPTLDPLKIVATGGL